MSKHLIFTSGRSGSNYLSNTLNLSPHCVNYGEVLGEWTVPHKVVYKNLFKGNEAAKYLDLIYSNDGFFYLGQMYSCFNHLKTSRKINFKLKSKVTSIGIKDFLVTMERNNGSLQYILDHPEIKVIHLYRDNILNRYLSGAFMAKSKQAVSYQTVKNSKVLVNTDDLFEKLNIYEAERNREEIFISGLKNHDIFNIEYEEYFKDSYSINSWNKKILEFLGLPPIAELSQQKKIMSNSIRDNVLNYDELVDSIKGTKYETYLN